MYIWVSNIKLFICKISRNVSVELAETCRKPVKNILAYINRYLSDMFKFDCWMFDVDASNFT